MWLKHCITNEANFDKAPHAIWRFSLVHVADIKQSTSLPFYNGTNCGASHTAAIDQSISPRAPLQGPHQQQAFSCCGHLLDHQKRARLQNKIEESKRSKQLEKVELRNWKKSIRVKEIENK
jgi:hypothetical protein